MSSDDGPAHRKLPSSLEQVFVVGRYELLKYLRSKRLIGTIAIVALIIGLLYLLPPSLGMQYTGHVDEALDVTPPPIYIWVEYGGGNLSFANLSSGWIQTDTIAVSVNGTPLDESGFEYISNLNALVFFQDYTGDEVVASYDFKRSAKSFAETFISFATTLIIICVVFFGADPIVSEYQNRTAYLLFPNPVRRETLFFGKLIASFVASLLMVSLFYAAVIMLSFATLGEFATYLPLSFGFAILFLLACLGLAYLVSSVMKGSTGAIVLTFFLLFMILPVIGGVGNFSGLKMDPLLTFAGDSVLYSLDFDDYPQDYSMEMMGIKIYNFYPDLGTSVIVLAAYAIILNILSLFIFRRKELTG